MIFFSRKRLIALVLACLTLCSTIAACAEPAIVMENAKVYAAAKTSSDELGKLKAGTQLELVAEKSGWAKVELNGNVGYMKADSVAEYKTYKNLSVYTTKSTAMYKSFSTSSKKLGTIPEGAEVTLSASAGNWARVTYKKDTGFVALSSLTKDAPAKKETFDSYTAYASVADATVYNINGKAIGAVEINTKVTVTAEKNGVCQVQRDGKTAYMMKNQLSTKKVEVKEEKIDITEIKATTYYVKNDNAKIYDTKGNVLGKLALNTAVTVTAYTDELAKITKDGKIYAMYRSDLSTKKVEVKEEKIDITEIKATTYYVKNDNAKIYDTKGNVLGKLALNTAVTVTAYTDELAKITKDGKIYAMYRSDLSTKKVKDNSSLVLEYGDTGEAVTKIQSRLKELGYFSGTVGGNYLDLTRAAVSAFQAAAGLTTTGVCDEATLTAMFSDKAPKKEAEKKEESSSSSNGTTAKAATGTAKAMDWWTSGIQSIFARGTVATITDVNTGIAWFEKRTGGTNHADVQPLTAADTAAMKKAVGGWSWNRRPVFVTINGVNYAASMNSMPHGSGSITNNNFNGHHCIHFTNSRTHGSNSICSLHQAAIQKAANATL